MTDNLKSLIITPCTKNWTYCVCVIIPKGQELKEIDREYVMLNTYVSRPVQMLNRSAEWPYVHVLLATKDE